MSFAWVPQNCTMLELVTRGFFPSCAARYAWETAVVRLPYLPYLHMACCWGLFSRDTQALDIFFRFHLRPGQLIALIHNLECKQTGTPGCLNVGIEFGNQQRKTPQSCRASPCRLIQEYQHAGSTRLKDKGALNLQHWQQINQLRLLRVPWIKGLSKFIFFPSHHHYLISWLLWLGGFVDNGDSISR